MMRRGTFGWCHLQLDGSRPGAFTTSRLAARWKKLGAQGLPLFLPCCAAPRRVQASTARIDCEK